MQCVASNLNKKHLAKFSMLTGSSLSLPSVQEQCCQREIDDGERERSLIRDGEEMVSEKDDAGQT